MQLRTFSARTTTAVLTQIKEELGPEAIILDTREEDGVVTMTAALERHHAEEPQKAMGGAAAPVGFGLAGGLVPAGSAWQEEWNCIKSHLLALMKPALKMDELPPRQRLALEFLQRQGVNDESVMHIFRRLVKHPEVSILDPLGRIVAVQPLGEESWPQRIQFLAGPFGAGKTSVAIRMALSLRKSAPGLRTCLVNADTTRGSGRLILRHYAELSDFAYKEAVGAMELTMAVAAAEEEGYDRILVDLPGLARGAFLAELLERAGLDHSSGRKALDIAVHLVLPPHYGEAQLAGMLERYRTGLAGSVVWTKLDEAEHFGQIVNVGLATGLPVSAVSYGPGLGSSLAPASASMLWRLLFKKELPGGE